MIMLQSWRTVTEAEPYGGPEEIKNFVLQQ